MRKFLNNYLEALSPLIPLLIIVFFYLQKRSGAINALLFHFLVSSILCVWIVIVSYYNRENIILYTTLCITTFYTLTAYYFVILKTRQNKRLVIASMVIYSLFFIVNILFWEDSTAFNSIGFATHSIFIVMFSFIYFRERLLLLDIKSISSKINLLAVISFFFYYAGSFFIFLTYKILTQKGVSTNVLEERKSLGTLWGIHNVIYFISCLLISIGLLWKKFQTRYIS